MESRVWYNIRFKEQKNDKNRSIGNSGVSLIVRKGIFSSKIFEVGRKFDFLNCSSSPCMITAYHI